MNFFYKASKSKKKNFFFLGWGGRGVGEAKVSAFCLLRIQI